MNRIVIILVSGLAVILMFLMGIVAYTYFENRSQSNVPVSPTPVVPVITVLPTPTSGAPSTLRGSVLSISTEPVGFKNSLIMTIQNATDRQVITIYVTPQTRIFNTANNIVPRTSLQTGMNISVGIEPAEGAYEATEIQIVSFISPTP